MTTTTTEFGGLLAELRTERRLSQSRLAETADYDHSYISRLENGTRNPTKDAVERLGSALHLTGMETSDLLLAAGFAPADPADPTLVELSDLLVDATIPFHLRESAQDMVISLASVLNQARRTAPEAVKARSAKVVSRIAGVALGGDDSRPTEGWDSHLVATS